MPKYDVYGTLTIPVRMVVMAETPEEAIEIAWDQWQCLEDYVGNGVTSGRLIGHTRTGVHIEAGSDEPNWNDAQLSQSPDDEPIEIENGE